jgi:hypothetical protein
MPVLEAGGLAAQCVCLCKEQAVVALIVCLEASGSCVLVCVSSRQFSPAYLEARRITVRVCVIREEGEGNVRWELRELEVHTHNKATMLLQDHFKPVCPVKLAQSASLHLEDP